MAFTVKNWTAYEDNPTTDKDIVMLHALPGGGGFTFINMTKEQFFNIASNMVIKFNPSGITDAITFDAVANSKLKILPSGIINFDRVVSILMSDDGTSGQIQLVNDASNSRLILGGSSSVNGNKAGQLELFKAGAALKAVLTSNINELHFVRLSDARNATGGGGGNNVDVRYRQDDAYQYVEPIDGGTTTISSRLYTCCIADASAGALSSYTFEMPDPTDGDRVRLSIIGTITTVNMTTPGAETIQGPITTASTFTRSEWLYVGAEGEWKRID